MDMVSCMMVYVLRTKSRMGWGVLRHRRKLVHCEVVETAARPRSLISTTMHEMLSIRFVVA